MNYSLNGPKQCIEHIKLWFDWVLLHYAMVTPLRKAASYEQRKTNVGSYP